MATLICFGFGYCAEHFIAEFAGKFERIVGTVRRAERAAILNAYQAGAVQTLVFDGVNAAPALNAELAQADHALVSIPPDESGEPVLAAFGEARGCPAWPVCGVAALLEARQGHPVARIEPLVSKLTETGVQALQGRFSGVAS